MSMPSPEPIVHSDAGLFTRLTRRFNSLVFYLLVAILVGAIGWLSNRYDHRWDWSVSSRNSLGEASLKLLERIPGPVDITVYVAANEELRHPIRALIEPYQHRKPDIQLRFVNPETEPEAVRQLGISGTGAMVVEYQGRKEMLNRLSEDKMTNALARLALADKGWVVALSGHGERSMQGQANHDLGDFSEALKRKGYRTQDLNLAEQTAIPANTTVLVLTDPQSAYMSGEREIVQRYLDDGGNLLWLADPQSTDGPSDDLAALGKTLGIEVLPGIIVDANTSVLGIDDPAIAMVPSYPAHPLTEGLDQISLFPHAAALEVTATGDWQAQPLLATLPRTWNETGPLKGEISADAAQGERQGPLNLGHALSRTIDGMEQKVVVIGDGDFLSNAFLGNVGNQDLGLRLIRWLAGDEALIDIPVTATPDLTLELSPTQSGIIGMGFLIALPTLFFLVGAWVWRRRSRQ